MVSGRHRVPLRRRSRSGRRAVGGRGGGRWARFRRPGRRPLRTRPAPRGHDADRRDRLASGTPVGQLSRARPLCAGGRDDRPRRESARPTDRRSRLDAARLARRPRSHRLRRPFRQRHDGAQGVRLAAKRSARRGRPHSRPGAHLLRPAAGRGLLVREFQRPCRDRGQSRPRRPRPRPRRRNAGRDCCRSNAIAPKATRPEAALAESADWIILRDYIARSWAVNSALRTRCRQGRPRGGGRRRWRRSR